MKNRQKIKCDDCLHCINYHGVKRCMKRSLTIDRRFIIAWGCDSYKPNYETLLKEERN